jgi:Spy/CpxP family protein refolding chaperone
MRAMHQHRRLLLAGCAAVLLTASAPTVAQRGGGGGGGGGEGAIVMEFSRLETLVQGFKLTKDQKAKTKAVIDDAHMSAAPIREQMAKARAAIAAAIQTGRGPSDVEGAVKDYATQVTAMTEVETKALANVMKVFTAEQRANAAGIQAAFFMFRGIFIDKKWDIIASGFYGY